MLAVFTVLTGVTALTAGAGGFGTGFGRATALRQQLAGGRTWTGAAASKQQAQHKDRGKNFDAHSGSGFKGLKLGFSQDRYNPIFVPPGGKK